MRDVGALALQPRAIMLAADAGSDAIREMQDILPSGITEEGLAARLGVEATLSWVLDLMRGEVPEAVRFFLLMLGAGVLYALATTLGERRRELGSAMRAGVGAILGVCVWSVLTPLALDAVETVREMARLCTLALPIFVGVHTATGAGESALATAAGLGGLVSVMEWLLSGVFLPVPCLYLGVSLIGSVGEEGSVVRLGNHLYRLFLSCMGLFGVVVSGVMSLQSALASAKDTLLLRTVRHATGTMIPVVGSTVSGALSTLLYGGAYAKQTVGTMALLGLLSVSLPLLCRLLLCRMAMGGLTLLPVSLTEGMGLFDTVRRALDLLLAMLSMAVALFLLAVILFLKSGGGYIA